MSEILFGQGAQFLARWIHFMAGVVWIGHLYYFNFVQGAFFNEVDANVKNHAISKLVPKALWWFRWGAMFTFLSGVYILHSRGIQAGGFGIYTEPWGTTILVGALMATLMFLNVWLIIWPNQKKVIASATGVLGGGQPLPDAAASGAKALLASRTNTLFSIPMLFLMGAASHYPLMINPEKLTIFWVVMFVLIGALEANAIKGKLGPLTTVKGVIHCGLGLTAVIYVIAKLFA